MSDYLTHYEMTADQQKAQLDHELKKHKITQEEETKRQQIAESGRAKRAEARSKTLQGFLVGIAVLLALSGIGFLLWTWTTGPETPQENTEVSREKECLAAGGGWVPKDLLGTSNSGLCVYPGKKAEAPDGQ